MAVFSTNQVRQLYVHRDNATKVTDPGYLTYKITGDGDVYIQNTNALGELTRSDLIKVKTATCTYAPASELRTPIKSVKVTLNSDVNSGEPIAGEDYILNIHFRQYVGMSDTDIYIKQGFVRAHSTMNASEFYTQLACSLFRNFMREPYPLVKFIIAGKEVAAVKNNTSTGKPEAYERLDNGTLKLITTTGADSVTIVEAPQEWRLGVKSQVPVYFDVYSANVEYEGDEALWATVTDITPKRVKNDSTISWSTPLTPDNSYGNGKTIADLEYFCHGERGDMYRGIAWPHNLVTEYLVDPTKEYHVLNIHYFYTGANESVQKSEKDITIVSTNSDLLDEIQNNIEVLANYGVQASTAIMPLSLEDDLDEFPMPKVNTMSLKEDKEIIEDTDDVVSEEATEPESSVEDIVEKVNILD